MSNINRSLLLILLVVATPAVVFIIVALFTGLSVSETISALVSQFTTRKQNLGMAGILGLFPLLIMGLILWLRGKFFQGKPELTSPILLGGFIPLMAVLLVAITGPVFGESSRTDIHAKADDVQPLLPGMKAPAFDVLDARGEPVRFDPATMSKPLVITFFRGGWCPYCNLHLAEMRKAESELQVMGFDIWFISIDRPEMLYESLEQPDIGYTLLSDSSIDATRAFGLAFQVDDKTIARYQTHDIDLEKASGEAHHVLPAPSTFLIGADGVIRFQYTNPEYVVRLHPDVLLAAARAYQDDVDNRLRRQQKARRAAKESAKESSN